MTDPLSSPNSPADASSSERWIVGVDVGGTFTDFFLFNTATRAVRYWKRPSTPSDPADAIINGLSELSPAHGIDMRSIDAFCHGSTVATNALLQRRGADVALVTTKGFRDLIEIGRQTRPDIFDLYLDRPEPIVPRERRFEIAERIGPDGAVITPLTDAAIDQMIEEIRASGCSAVAVCFLFAFINPEHEARVATAIRQALPEVSVSASSEVQPEFREFERFSTTAVNAYLQPVLERYLDHLGSDVADRLPEAFFGICQSNGGLMSLSQARLYPVRMALSGPAAGVAGVVEIARSTGRPNLITIDIGGTSADVAIVRDGRAEVSYSREIDGFPIRLPMVDITTVGAGGGSIAWLDQDGIAKVGPQSAGAVPGPACYNRGGTEATISDANLVLGRLGAELVNGGLALDAGLAQGAVQRFADTIGMDPVSTARGIIAIGVANMVRAIRTLSVERGHDPRDFTLVAFGGAGPLHARDIALALGIKEILVPLAPGILCAQGLLYSGLTENFVASRRIVLDEAALPAIEASFAELGGKAAAWLDAEEIPAERRTIEYSMDVRYVGQNFELSLKIPAGEGGAGPRIGLQQTLEQFWAEHTRAYGFHDATQPVEVVNVRVLARGAIASGIEAAPAEASGEALAPRSRPVHFGAGDPVETPVYRREQFGSGAGIVGPAVIEQLDTTTLVYPGDRATFDLLGNLIITISEA